MLTGEGAHGRDIEYVCPLDAGPAWRQAVAEGADMSLVERCLGKRVWDRLRDHVDICCRFSRDNLVRLQTVLAPLHPRHRKLPQRPPLELTEALGDRLKNLTLETDACVLDCLSEVAGVGGSEAVLAQSILIPFPGGAFRVLSLDGLIRAKAAMDRPQDRLALTQLRAIRERRGAGGSSGPGEPRG